MNAYKNASYVGFVLCIFGIIIAIYGFSFLLKQNDLNDNAVIVKGTIFRVCLETIL